MSLPQSKWFEPAAPANGQALRLFCFPYAGGSAQVYRPWQKHLSPDVSMVLVHLPGRGRRISEPPFTNLKPLVQALSEVITAALTPPFAFWGHSMGALISFELARDLRRKGRPGPLALYVSGCNAPQIPDTHPLTYNLPEPEFIAELRRLNGTPPELLEDVETRNLFLPLIRADFEVVDTYAYEPGEPLSCPIYAYGGLEDANVTVDAVRGWQMQTSGRFTPHLFPGDHFFIHAPATNMMGVLRHDILTTLNQAAPLHEAGNG